jgi:hypothetical protein
MRFHFFWNIVGITALPPWRSDNGGIAFPAEHNRNCARLYLAKPDGVQRLSAGFN